MTRLCTNFSIKLSHLFWNGESTSQHHHVRTVEQVVSGDTYLQTGIAIPYLPVTLTIKVRAMVLSMKLANTRFKCLKNWTG